MITTSLITIYKRDLQKLKVEMESYSTEDNLWRVDKNISNSAGNLCLHLTGNLDHFIGAILGNTGYIRERDKEFSVKNMARAALVSQIEATEKMIENVLSSLTKSDLEKSYPLEVFGHAMTTEYFLMHLATHLNYHLGQINYHRRLLD